jgi:tRNA-2-methylthio-N6-dimethylallyladenosine synthase
MRYFIETYGCQMNVHDSERMAGLLEASGYESTDDERDADVIVVNTCSVRERAEDKLYTRLGEIRILKRGEAGEKETDADRPIVVVTGCVAQQEGGSILKRSSGVDVVLGTQQTRQLPMLVGQARSAGTSPVVDIRPLDEVSFPLGLVRRQDPVKAYVTIIEGCNDFCSFCVVPYTRGHERMRARQEIVDEVRAAAASGHAEVHLLGQIVNHYRAPDVDGCDFAALLEAVHEVPGVRRIRFASPHPRHVTPRMIAAMRDLPNVCSHLHLPVQSGSTRVLGAMRRRHTREGYLDLVARLRDAIPDLALSTDMIVGFPGETAEDFDATLSLVEQVRYRSMFSFKYSPRPNTLAGQRMSDDVAEEEKTRRIVALQALQRGIQSELHAEAVGSVQEVLVDSTSRRRQWEVSGRTAGNTVVNFPGSPDQLGAFVRVRITRSGPHSLSGESVAVGSLDRPGAEAYG